MKGTRWAIWIFALAFMGFIGVNAFQMWGVYDVYHGWRDVAGFPVTCYSRGGVGIAWLDTEAALLNCYVAFSAATHAALGVLLGFNPSYIEKIITKILK